MKQSALDQATAAVTELKAALEEGTILTLRQVWHLEALLEQVVDLKNDYICAVVRSGRPQKHAAATFGCTRSQISQIVAEGKKKRNTHPIT